jgi:hypothetical protein
VPGEFEVRSSEGKTRIFPISALFGEVTSDVPRKLRNQVPGMPTFPRLSPTSLVVNALLAGAVAVFAWIFSRLVEDGGGVALVIAAGAGAIGLSLAWSFFLPLATRINIVILVVTTSLMLFVADWGLGWWLGAVEARDLPVPNAEIDRRGRVQVLQDYRKQDSNWYPAVPANTFIGKYLTVNGEKIIPLTAVPLAHTIGCNEAGYYSTYQTDEYGFNNPPETWSADVSDGLFFVGDSFTQGACVNQGSGYVDQVRNRIPNVINIASGGNGPLLELASIREYLPSKFRNTVFWAYYEGNDLMDLNRDRSDPMLAAYLDREFRQGLIEMQDRVGLAVREYVEKRFAAKQRGRPWLLGNIRGVLWKWRHAHSEPEYPEGKGRARHDIDLFKRTLRVARQDVTDRGGRLVFIYLPEFFRYGPGHLSYWAEQRDEVLAVVKELNIDIIDLEPKFSSHPDPVGLFPLRRKGHYNESGYALVASAIIEYLGEDAKL